MKFTQILLAIFALFILTACEKKKTPEELNATTHSSLTQGERLNFKLSLNSGREIFIKANEQKLDFENQHKATMFVFFTPWCKPCTAMNPSLNKLQDKYKEGFSVIGVLLEEKDGVYKGFGEGQSGINYEISSGEGNYLLAKSVGGVNSLPTILLYASDGRLIGHYVGIVPQEMLDMDIQKALM